MELPFYLMSRDSPGTSWDGVISLLGDELHVALQAGGGGKSTQFDIPLEVVSEPEFQRGLVGRKFSLRVGSPEIRKLFPAGVSGENIQLMVARDDVEFGGGTKTEGEFERLVGQIAERTATLTSGPRCDPAGVGTRRESQTGEVAALNPRLRAVIPPGSNRVD